ncbi:MAG: AEC family transporter [Halanaeroarchaeum sp.]
MASLVSVFVEAVLPVLAIAAAGYLLGTFRNVAVEPLNTVTLYVLLPALVLHSLLSSRFGSSVALALVAAMLAFTFLMLLVSTAAGRLFGESGPRLSALVLAGSFPNTGNFGIPVATFAFGDVGRSVAVIFVVVQNVLIYSLGVAIVTRGEGRTWRSSLGRIARLPPVYAVLIAALLYAFGRVPPAGGTVVETLRLLGEASIPLFLLILGIQLQEANPGIALRRTVPGVGLKLLVAPVVGLGVAYALLIDAPVVARSFVLLCAGPIAVGPLVVFVEYEEGPSGLSGAEYLSTAVFVTTLGSILVVTGLIVLLRSGTLL